MSDFVQKYSHNVTSQNGENGIIDECMKRINPELKVAVEFGAPDKDYCSNISQLKGWELRYYSDQESEGVEKKYITEKNVNELPDCSVLSVDIDGNDLSVWNAYKGDPDIVIIEINSSLNPEIEFFHPLQGASFCTMLRVGNDKGYFLLCHTGNMIFILNKHKELFPEIKDIKPIELFNKSWL